MAKPCGKVELRPHQVAFQLAHKDCPCFVLVQIGSGRSTEVMLYAGAQAEQLKKDGVDTPALVKMSYPFEWEKIEQAIDKC